MTLAQMRPWLRMHSRLCDSELTKLTGIHHKPCVCTHGPAAAPCSPLLVGFKGNPGWNGDWCHYPCALVEPDLANIQTRALSTKYSGKKTGVRSQPSTVRATRAVNKLCFCLCSPLLYVVWTGHKRFPHGGHRTLQEMGIHPTGTLA